MKTINIGILGLGTVGGGTLSILLRNSTLIENRTGCKIQVTRALVNSLERERSCDISNVTLTTDANDILNDDSIDIVLELMGGEEPAKSYVLTALKKGKHVVTANKALVAVHGNELFAVANEHNVNLLFESSVAGGIPVIKAIRDGLAANDIDWLAGIINGTGNFILTEMRDKQRPFADVLKEAQELGYAEADPTFDIEGIDAAHKLTILASIVFSMPLQFDKVYTEGIANITPDDIVYACEMGYQIKHLGVAKHHGDSVELRVHPTLIPKKRLLANVDGVMNAVAVHGDAVGTTLYYGAGAGAEPTGSAVVADIIDIARNISMNSDRALKPLGVGLAELTALQVLPIDEVESAFYVRLRVEDKPGVLADITSIMADHNVSIEALLQKEPTAQEKFAGIVMLTDHVIEKQFKQAMSLIEKNDAVIGALTIIRVETLD